MSAVFAVRRISHTSRSTSLGLAGGLLVAVSAVGASSQSLQIQRELTRLQGYYAIPASASRDRRRERFRTLSRQWRAETQWVSSTTELAMHPAYQAIIGMGKDAIPLILEDLRDNSGHWYWALKAISNEDPVPSRDRGSVKKMKGAWLRWGQAKGIVAA